MTRPVLIVTLVLLALLCPAPRAACAAAKPPADREPPRVVYKSGFQEPLGDQWSRRKTDVSPKGARRFLGQFGNEAVTLTLKDLPDHAFVRLSFDLLIIRTWDGNDTGGVGPDVWSLRVPDGPTLLRATFANGLLTGCDKQTFPDRLPGPLYPRRTGAVETDVLGFNRADPQESDAIYRLRFVFGHSAKQLQLAFSASGLDELSDESWGLDDVTVEVFRGPPGPEMPNEELKDLWLKLLGDDPVQAHKALWALAGAGDKAVVVWKDHYGPARALGRQRIVELIARLDDVEWGVREEATERLKARRQEAEAALRQALETADSPEVQHRVQQILKAPAVASAAGPEAVRRARIIHLMDVVGSEPARHALTELAKTLSQARIKQYAQAVLSRLNGRKIQDLLAAADRKAKSLDPAGAAELARQALAVAKEALPSAESEIETLLERFNALAAALGKASKLQAALKAHPEDSVARDALLRVHLIELDSPAEAGKYLGPDSDAAMRRNLPLAARRIGKLSAAECLALAEWYHHLAADVKDLAKLAMLERAETYYEKHLGQAKAPGEKVRGLLAKLRGELIGLKIRFGAKYLTLDLGGVSLKMARIPAGKFLMGSPPEEPGRRTTETQHPVTLTSPFYMALYETTRGQFARFVRDTHYETDAEKLGSARVYGESAWEDGQGACWRKPGFAQTDEHPAVCMSWNDAEAFCQWLSKKTGRTIRLPTDAEWEYACRAGAKSAYQWGENPDGGAGWLNAADLTGKQTFPRWANVFPWQDGYVYTAPVGRFKPNAFGLYDMHGNVCEWCRDFYGRATSDPVTDPVGPAGGRTRVIHRGAWCDRVPGSRAAFRESGRPDLRIMSVGFRVVLGLKELPKPAAQPPPPQPPRVIRPDGQLPVPMPPQ